MAGNNVIWFDSSEAGAPVLNNAAGSLLGVLQACLVDGFGIKSVSGITVSANVATAVCAGHSFSGVKAKLVLIAGAGTAAVNGDKQITVVDANTFTFPAPGVADGTITGTITAKRAPLGWQRQYTATNKSVYRSTDPTSTQHCLRVDDTAVSPASATGARARMFESMTSVDSGTNPGPADDVLTNGAWWGKGANSATARKWVLVGDGKRFYFSIQQSGDSDFAGGWRFFGDVISYRSADPFACAIFGEGMDSADAPPGNVHAMAPTAISSAPQHPSVALSRIATGVGTAVRASLLSAGGALPGAASEGIAPAYPSPVDGGAVFVRPVLVREKNDTYSHPIRGEMPGLAFPIAGIGSLIPTLTVLSAPEGAEGSTFLLCAWRGNSSYGFVRGLMVFDISGTW